MLVGGYAYAIYASPRYTKDIDIFYACESKNAEKMITILQQFCFGSLEIEMNDFLRKGHVIQLGMPPYRINLINQIEVYHLKMRGKRDKHHAMESKKLMSLEKRI